MRVSCEVTRKLNSENAEQDGRWRSGHPSQIVCNPVCRSSGAMRTEKRNDEIAGKKRGRWHAR